MDSEINRQVRCTEALEFRTFLQYFAARGADRSSGNAADMGCLRRRPEKINTTI